MCEVETRIENLGLTLSALPDLLGAPEAAIHAWIRGTLTTEQADIMEVALSMLEVRLARLSRRYDETQVIAAIG